MSPDPIQDATPARAASPHVPLEVHELTERPLSPAELPAPATEFLLGEPRDDMPLKEAWKLVAMREHTLLSLSELSQELSISLDLFSLADLVLFNLMGQLGTARAALWLMSENGTGTPVLVRSHGVSRPIARALGPVCTSRLLDHLSEKRTPVPVETLEPVVGAAAVRLMQRADIAVFSALRARGETLGLLALGPRIGGLPYGSVELETLRAALAMVGVAVQNMTFYNRLLESHRRLRLANQEFEHLDRLKSEFLSNVNHELRTPLTCIIAYVDALLGPQQDPDLVRDFLQVVLEEAHKLNAMLENLLAFSAATQEKLVLETVSGDVSIPLARYYEERLPGVSGTLRELVFEPDHRLPMAFYDEKRMLQVVDALIDNAVKFTPQGARIRIGLAERTDAEGRWVRIDVADDGPGISADRLPHLFESFRQLDGSSTRSVGGMGIGLSFARQLAVAMGGRLGVVSELGRGSTFSLDLPVAP